MVNTCLFKLKPYKFYNVYLFFRGGGGLNILIHKKHNDDVEENDGFGSEEAGYA